MSALSTTLVACGAADPPIPTKIIDLSPAITEDLSLRIWGRRLVQLRGFPELTRSEHFVVREPAYIANSFLTLHNHGGPHVDALNHLIEGGPSVTDWRLEQLIGPLIVVDIRSFAPGQMVPRSFLEEQPRPAHGRIVLLFTGYIPPQNDQDLPQYPYLSPEAAEYLASLPVKAVATDALSVETPPGERRSDFSPKVHLTFFSRGIPIIEQLTNVEAVMAEDDPVFVGFPLKIEGGNASPIRAAVLIY
jgi:kynurenine formamidase